MKKAIALLAVLITAGTLFAMDLSKSAADVRDVFPSGYAVIKAAAIAEWGDDHGMVLYMINQQCDAAVKFLALAQDYPDEAFSALAEWTDGGMATIDRYISEDKMLFDIPSDWNMALYEANRQIEAEGKY